LASGAFQQTNNCTFSLGAGSICTITVQYIPTASGAQTGTLSVSDVTRTQPQTVALSGMGILPPGLNASPVSLTFTGQQVGVASSPQTLTVTNTGGAPLANVAFQITGLNAASFAWSASTCGATLSNVSGQNSCTVQVVFTPSAVGGASASLVISSTTAGVKAVAVTLNGAGQTPAGLNVSPAQLLFPVVALGQSSQPLTVTLTNTGGLTANSLTLTATPPFSLLPNTCGSTLAGGASCSAGVVFTPPLSGTYSGTLTIASPSLTASAVVPLSGTGGVPGSVRFQPTVLVFQQTGVGITSSPTTVTITNPDSVNSLSSLALAVTKGFNLVNNTCPATLPGGASCTLGIEFAPVSPGTQRGSLNVSSDALPAGAFLALSGMGFDFIMAPTGASAQTVVDGQTADFKLSITPLNGSQGVFTFKCGTLPPYTSCAFNPASEGITANSTGSILVQIATGLTQTTARASRPFARPRLPLACGLMLLPFALRRRRKVLLLVALLIVFASGLSSCTQSGGGLPAPPSGNNPGITPASMYLIPVTATSNGIQRQLTLTLTVD
jgi:hypothetical protein